MTFLAPVWILLAGAAAVPLLLHLLRRRSGVRAEFPAARYLARAEREHSRSLRLRNLLLMLLRVLVLLLLAFAAARPAIPWGAGRTPVALAIVVDNSLSTSVVEGGQPVLAALLDSARLIVDAARESDRVWIVTADERVAGGAPASARQALAAVRSLASAGDVPAAVRRAGATAGGAPGHAPRVVVLTDGQRAAWPARAEVPDGIDYVVVTPGTEAPPNRGVIHAEPSPLRWTSHGTLGVAVHSDDTVAFRVALLGAAVPRTIARGAIAPHARQSVRVAPSDTGWVAGIVEIDPDELPGDDARYFAAWIGAPPGISVGDATGAFTRSALDVMREDGRVRDGRDIRIIAAPELGGAGPVFIVAPVQSSQLGAANQALARRGVPWRFGAMRGGGRLAGPLVDGTVVRERFALVGTRAAGVDTLATVGGEPWAVAGDTPDGPYVLVGSALMPDATDLPVRAAFVPWLAATLFDRLVAGAGGVMHVSPGDDVTMPPWADSLMIGGNEPRDVGEREFTAPAAPGVHFFSRNGRRVGALVVNVEENESVLARMDDGELTRVLGGRSVRLAHAGGRWRDALFVGQGARPVVVPVLLAVLALLGIELAATTVRPRGAA